jgi:hypothetical protein
MTTAKKNLHQTTETPNYIVQYNKQKSRWELRGKLGTKTYFMNGCEFQTPLLIVQRDLESKKNLKKIALL